MKLKKVLLLLSLTCTGVFLGCGTNAFENLEETPPQISATLALEDEKPEKSIEILLDALGSDYKNYYNSISDNDDITTVQTTFSSLLAELIDASKVERPANLVSILASAKAQLHGIDPLSIALELANIGATAGESEAADATDSSSTNPITVLFPVLPDASSANIRGLEIALALLRSIGSEYTDQDQFKEALFLSANVSLIAKTLDSDGDGEISALEAINLSDEAAGAILNQLASAATAAAATSSDSDSNTQKSTEQIATIQAAIDAQEGATDEEKVRNYIAQSGGSEPALR